MGRCEPRANENDPGLITLPEASTSWATPSKANST